MKRKIIKISVVIIFIMGLASLIYSFCFDKTPLWLRATERYFKRNPQEVSLNLGMSGGRQLCITNFQVYKGNFYYRNLKGNLTVKNLKDGTEKEYFEIPLPFWIENNNVFYLRNDEILRYNMQTKNTETILSKIWGNKCVEVEDNKIFYFSRDDYMLHSYDMITDKISNYDIENCYLSYLGVLDSHILLVSDDHIFLYRLEDMKHTEIPLRDSHCYKHMAKIKSDMYFSVSGYDDGDIMTQKNWGDNGVYRIDFEKMELVKISADTYDWIFATSDKLYGVKQKLWGLYDTIEEIECQVVK